MVITCFHISSYMCATSFCVCMVHEFAFISFSGLHSFIEMCASRMINGRGGTFGTKNLACWQDFGSIKNKNPNSC